MINRNITIKGKAETLLLYFVLPFRFICLENDAADESFISEVQLLANSFFLFDIKHHVNVLEFHLVIVRGLSS